MAWTEFAIEDHCGGELHPQPRAESLRGHFCSVVGPDNGVLLVKVLLIYGPLMLVLGGAAVAVAKGDWRVLLGAAAAACGWVLVLSAALVLPAT